MSTALLEAKRIALEEQLNTFIQQYAAVSEDLRTNLDARSIVKLKEQQAILEKQIETVDAQLQEVLGNLESAFILRQEMERPDSEERVAGKHASITAVPKVDPPPFGLGKKRAVLVGINEYEDQHNYGQLNVCVQDVEAVGQKLSKYKYEAQRVRTLTDTTRGDLPTRNRIITSLRSAADASDADDLLLFYYSGHGDMVDGVSYLVARDGFKNSLSDTAIPVPRVEQIMRGAAARAKVIILDACHSGADIGGKGPASMSEDFIKRVFEQAEGLAILSSCKQGQLSYERDEKDRSAFTHYLLEALSGSDYDGKGFVTVHDVSRYVVSGVKDWAAQKNRSQTPTLEYQVAGDIILVDHRQ